MNGLQQLFVADESFRVGNQAELIGPMRENIVEEPGEIFDPDPVSSVHLSSFPRHEQEFRASLSTSDSFHSYSIILFCQWDKEDAGKRMN
jgi:hypothetical protein